MPELSPIVGQGKSGRSLEGASDAIAKLGTALARVPRIRKGNRTFTEVVSWREAFASAASDLSCPSRSAVALAISMHMSSRGDNAWPAAATIAARAKCSRRTVFYALAELVGRGWLVKESRPGRTNYYRAAVPEWWAGAYGEHGEQLLTVGGSESEGDASQADPLSDPPTVRSSSADRSSMKRAHRFIDNTGWQYEEADAREELRAMLAGRGEATHRHARNADRPDVDVDETALEVLLERWRSVKRARAGPEAAAA